MNFFYHILLIYEYLLSLGFVENFYKKCVDEFKLNIIGLMSIPPFDKDSKPYFTKMRELSENLNLDYKFAVDNNVEKFSYN